MNLNRENTKDITLVAPCDLYGNNARLLRSAASGGSGRIFLEKTESRARCDASNLLDVLRLGIRKGDHIRLFVKDGLPDLSDVASTLDALAS